jgi:two-component system response regulator DesR
MQGRPVDPVPYRQRDARLRAGDRAGRPDDQSMDHTAPVSARRVAVIRVVLVEDMRLLRGALVALLAKEADIDVVGESGWDDALVPLAVALVPDVVVMNTEASAGQLFSTITELRVKAGCSVLVLVDPRKPFTFPPGMQTRSLNLLDRDAPPALLAETVRRVAEGERVIAPQIAVAALVGAEHRLTGRELEVLELAAEGASVSEIADRLFLSLGTVRNYLSAVTAKTGARNRIDAIRIARKDGWLR